MVITDRSVRSVLRIYSRRLEESKTTSSSKEENRINGQDKNRGDEVVSISDDARRYLMERIKSQALAVHRD